MDYLVIRGIAVVFPKSVYGLAREFVEEANRTMADPHIAIGVFKGGYTLLIDGEVVEYSLDNE